MCNSAKTTIVQIFTQTVVCLQNQKNEKKVDIRPHTHTQLTNINTISWATLGRLATYHKAIAVEPDARAPTTQHFRTHFNVIFVPASLSGLSKIK